jgi:hypothetical protein
MDHSYFQSRLSAFADGELPADEQAQVGEHLEACSECRRRLDELRRLEELTERQSELPDDEYWERAALKIEAKLETQVTEVSNKTDLRPVRAKSGSSLWWKLPAIAASILVVGYIGLHEDEILKDDVIVLPQESVNPSFSPSPLIEIEETDDAQVEMASPTADHTTSPTPTAASDTDRGTTGDDEVELETATREVAEEADYESNQSDVREVRTVREESSASTAEKISPSKAAAAQPELSESVGEPKVRPTRSKTRTKVTASDVGDGKNELADLALPPVTTSPPEINRMGLSQASLGQVANLDTQRRQRDSLMVLITDLEPDSTRPARQKRLKTGLTKTGSGNRTYAAKKPDTLTAREQARVELVDVWCRICQDSDDEAEISQGIEFLRRAASVDRPGRKEAANCLKLLDRQ